jgi:hypothetical protein
VRHRRPCAVGGGGAESVTIPNRSYVYVVVGPKLVRVPSEKYSGRTISLDCPVGPQWVHDFPIYKRETQTNAVLAQSGNLRILVKLSGYLNSRNSYMQQSLTTKRVHGLCERGPCMQVAHARWVAAEIRYLHHSFCIACHYISCILFSLPQINQYDCGKRACA